MVVGLHAFDSEASGSVYNTYNITNRHITGGFEVKTFLDNSGSFEGGGKLELGAGTKEEGQTFVRTGGEANLKYTTDLSKNVDFGITSDVHFGYGHFRTKRTKTQHDSESGYNYYKPSQTVGTAFYISPTVGTEIGVSDGTDGRFHLYGKVGKDLVKGDDFQKVGIVYEKPIGGNFGDNMQATVFAQGDYTFNNKNTTFNLNDRSGVNVGAGIRMYF